MLPPKAQPAKTGAKPPDQRIDFGKQADKLPDWARPDRIIGYTFQGSLNVASVEDLRRKLDPAKGATQAAPSVYYMGGHVTLQHAYKGNLGWTVDSYKWKWLFFGNVFKKDGVHLKGDWKTRIREAKRIRDTYGGYCQGDGRVTFWDQYAFRIGTSPQAADERLMEIWVSSACDAWNEVVEIHSHPSRNQFRWIDDTNLKASLHGLALAAFPGAAK
jgi:hypothetical protein